MAVRIPKTMTFYCASEMESEYLLCWIPPGELESMLNEGKVRPDVLQYHPDGLEVEVSSSAFTTEGIKLGVQPKILRKVYLGLWKRKQLPESGLIDGMILIERAKKHQARTSKLKPKSTKILAVVCQFITDFPIWRSRFKEPTMTEGIEPEVLFRQLAEKRDSF